MVVGYHHFRKHPHGAVLFVWVVFCNQKILVTVIEYTGSNRSSRPFDVPPNGKFELFPSENLSFFFARRAWTGLDLKINLWWGWRLSWELMDRCIFFKLCYNWFRFVSRNTSEDSAFFAGDKTWRKKTWRFCDAQVDSYSGQLIFRSFCLPHFSRVQDTGVSQSQRHPVPNVVFES